MPSHHGVGLDEHERAPPVVPRLGQHDPKQAISPPKLRTGDSAFQRVELLPEREILEDEFVMSATGQRHSADEEKDGLKHASILSCYAQGINVGRAVLILANDSMPYPRSNDDPEAIALGV
jgi:hypothetical protein